MIYLISDLHGGADAGGFRRHIEAVGDNDITVILGDVGLKFEDTEECREFGEWFLSLTKKIAIIDGNHENHAYLRSFPEDTEYGGTVHRLTNNIVYLKRGHIYEIEGKSCFVMGGCKSSKKWFDIGLVYEGEVPSADEIALGRDTLQKAGNRVDYILTHKYQKTEGDSAAPDTLEGLTAYIDKNVSFKRWYAGHFHSYYNVDALHTIVYTEAIELE